MSASPTWCVASLGTPAPSSWWSDCLAEMLTARYLYAELTHPLAGSQALHGVAHWQVRTFCFPTACHPEMTLAWLSRYTVLTKWSFSVPSTSCSWWYSTRKGSFSIPQLHFLGKIISTLRFPLWSSIPPLRNGESQWGKTQCAACICLCKHTCLYAKAHAHRCPVDARGQLCRVRGPGTWCLVSITPMDEQWWSA